MKISDGLKHFLPRTHHNGFSTTAFQNDFEKFSRVGIIIYRDYLDVSKDASQNKCLKYLKYWDVLYSSILRGTSRAEY